MSWAEAFEKSLLLVLLLIFAVALFYGGVLLGAAAIHLAFANPEGTVAILGFIGIWTLIALLLKIMAWVEK